jgi:hypothetical protein
MIVASRFGGIAGLDVVTVGAHRYVDSGDDEGSAIHVLLPANKY